MRHDESPQTPKSSLPELLSADAPVVSDPLYKIEYASHKKGFGPKIILPYREVPEPIAAAVRDALRLALQFIVHPNSIRTVAYVLSDSSRSEVVTTTIQAVRTVLATTTWYIGISDEYLEKETAYAWHERCDVRHIKANWARTLYLPERVSTGSRT